jgi:hypothetical protein
MNMILSKLTPAETLLIRQGEGSPMKDLLKYTFMDLLLKQVLEIRNLERQPNSRDPIMTYKYVYAGPNFNRYACLPHELIYLSIFHKSAGSGILFRNCVKMGYENARSQRALHKTIQYSPGLQSVFSISLLEIIFGGFSYTAKGKQWRDLIEKEIEELEREMPLLIAHDKDRALEKMKLIGGNIFLLNGLVFTLLSEIDAEFVKEFKKEESAGGCGGGCSTFASDFDSSCSSDSSGDGSGCSSGDSGCGGGCGGCGGD